MIDGDLPPRPWTTGNDNNGHVTVFDASGEVVFLSIRKSLALPLMGMVNAGTPGEGVTHRCARCGIKWNAPLGPFSWACPVCDRAALEARDSDVERASTHHLVGVLEEVLHLTSEEPRSQLARLDQINAVVRVALAKVRGAESGLPTDFRDSSSKDIYHDPDWHYRDSRFDVQTPFEVQIALSCPTCGCTGCVEGAARAACPTHGIDAVDPAMATGWVRDPCAACGRLGKWHPPAP